MSNLSSDSEQKIYTDQTGKFLARLYQGNQYIMVLVEMDRDIIFTEPFKNWTSGELIKTYQILVNWVCLSLVWAPEKINRTITAATTHSHGHVSGIRCHPSPQRQIPPHKQQVGQRINKLPSAQRRRQRKANSLPQQWTKQGKQKKQQPGRAVGGYPQEEGPNRHHRRRCVCKLRPSRKSCNHFHLWTLQRSGQSFCCNKQNIWQGVCHGNVSHWRCRQSQTPPPQRQRVSMQCVYLSMVSTITYSASMNLQRKSTSQFLTGWS